MKKLLAATVAGLMVFGTTAAQAETRPSATEFSKPVNFASDIGNQDDDDDDDGALWLLILLGVGGLAGLLLAASSSQGNSPR
ncbi:hypothetical protein [Parerythrobacter aestuarii]|uniref:hypothetical protein n=1 Tax=Parerythrobacter aestuarii TaxID=3020909 RepID=UPI0024DEACA5|nr:hypothetical protein [Parerythrobacter aestuarii]